MGQDSEAAAEYVATVRGEHTKMKEWYTASAPAALKQQYGDYPALWKEALNWPGWKEARREYLKHTQKNESSSSSSSSSGNNNTHDETQVSIPRKRKSRWGTKESATPAATTAPPPPKRPAALPLPGLGPLTPQQQEEMKHMQEKLRRVNERLENLDKEAARVDALPRGHRERSPSPPPSKCCYANAVSYGVACIYLM